ncbi:hypothetical protein B0H10DRAFT_639755 [Mycena sp. CBHHK59/15]|nr:hypothetical protein B0H10DRAFT_639755 [Mycena sp. CBHHK59/15]
MGFWKSGDIIYYSSQPDSARSMYSFYVWVSGKATYYIKYFLPRHPGEKNNTWLRGQEKEAKRIYDTILQERLLTYGSSELSGAF